ncbi:MAG: methyltransferase domain-containing protein [candidate division Zixibacteria bacterium]|nr:methyltransferase domain-containing protein [Candidatus Tariuqbacter arcticus]
MTEDLVQKHFHKKADDFDSIYTGQKSGIARLLDKWFRWDMEKRFQRTIEECGDVSGKTIIDVGCGSGRFMEVLQGKNPSLILGLDFVPNMLIIARKILSEQMADNPCELATGDFNRMEFRKPFDITLAIGLFDYIAEPLQMLKKMRHVTREKLIATFPRAGTLRSAIRKVRLSLYKCPVYFFKPEQVRSMMEEAGFTDIQLEAFGQLIFATGKPFL